MVVAKEGLNAEGLHEVIVTKLCKNQIQLSNCIVQTYDGASVMSGKHRGVSTQIKKRFPHAYYTHCYNHRLNLVLVSTCNNVGKVGDCLQIILSIYKYFSGSVINSEFMKQHDTHSTGHSFRLKRHCDTRWVSRFESCDSVIRTLPAILNTLHYFADDKDPERSNKANVLLKQIDTVFVAHVIILRAVLGDFKKLSKCLQDETIDLATAVDLVKATCSALQEYIDCHHSDKWDKLFQYILDTCRMAEVPKPFERPIRCIRKDLIDPKKYCTKGELMDGLVKPMVKAMVDELSKRFNSDTGTIYEGVCTMIPTNYKFMDSTRMIAFGSKYGMNTNDLSDEIRVLTKLYRSKTANDEFEEPENLSEFHAWLKQYREPFTQIYKLCTISICLGISSAGCERSFSALKRIKSWTRSSMGDERLDNLAILNVNSDRTRLIIAEEIVSKFAQSKNRSLRLF